MSQSPYTTKHTPGPWRSNNAVVEVANGMAAQVAIAAPVKIGTAPKTREEQLANARLIASAPELLEALQDAEFLLRKIAANPSQAYAMQDSFHRSASDARAIIAKAEGREVPRG